MQREIKFRGKRVDNGEWVYGLPQYSVIEGKVVINIIQSSEDLLFYEIVPETVGQYTGLKDKNKKERDFYESQSIEMANIADQVINEKLKVQEELETWKRDAIESKAQLGEIRIKFGMEEQTENRKE